MAASMAQAHRLALVFGPEVDRDGGWDGAVALAEHLQAPCFTSPNSHRCSFPETHKLFAGFLPAAPGPLAQTLAGFDVIAVFGAPVFTFHVEGHCPLFDEGGPAIWQLTADPGAAACAGAGIAILGALAPALAALLADLPPSTRTPPPVRPRAAPEPGGVLTAARVLHLLAARLPPGAIVAEEAPSHRTTIQREVAISQPGSFFTMASGGLGWSLPAAVGLALASPHRRVVAVIGDGSMMYSIQALFTAARMRLPIIVIVLNNGGYGAMRAFSRSMGLQGAPGIDIDGLDFPALAAGHGCAGVRVETEPALIGALDDALASDRPWVIDAAVDPSFGELYAART